jgi:cobalt-zinc-cadmium efflux system protein
MAKDGHTHHHDGQDHPHDGHDGHEAHDGHDHDGADHAHDHGHDHAHDHGAELRTTPTFRLGIALALTVTFMVVEAVAGLLSRSLALLSDAGHMLTDAAALALALLAQRIAARARTGARTFGYRRAEILAALANGAFLGASAVWIIVEGARRVASPPEIRGWPLLIVAALGLAVNLIAAVILTRGRPNANVRAAAAHVAADAVGSVAALLAGAAVLLFGWTRADAIASIAISLLILWSAWRLVKEAVDVLMEGAPADLVDRVTTIIRDTPGVADVHDLHVWSISDDFPIVTAHVVLDGGAHGVEVVEAVTRRIRAATKIDHVTIQPEPPHQSPIVPTDRLRRR